MSVIQVLKLGAKSSPRKLTAVGAARFTRPLRDTETQIHVFLLTLFEASFSGCREGCGGGRGSTLIAIMKN